MEAAARRPIAWMFVLRWEMHGIREFTPGDRTSGFPFLISMPTCIPPPTPHAVASLTSNVTPADVCRILLKHDD